MKRRLLVILSIVSVVLSASAQRVRFELSFSADKPADVSKVYVQALPHGEVNAVPLRFKGDRYTGSVPVSVSGFYEVVMVINDGQWIIPVYSTKSRKIELSMEFNGNAVLEKSSVNNMALSELNSVILINNRKLWLTDNLSDEAMRSIIGNYFTVSDSLVEALKPSTSVAKYMKAMAYTGAQSFYTSIPRAQRRALSKLAFTREDVLPSSTDVLDNECAALIQQAMQSVFSEVSDKTNGDLDEMLKELYNTYKCKAVKEKVADLAVKRFLTRYKYASDFEGGLEYLKSVVEYFDLSSHYVKEYMKHKASLIGADFPENVVLVNADNEVVDFSTFKGKFVYIDLWTSWCVPCCKEIPHLQAIEKEFEDSDIVFVSISTDTDEDAWKERMEEYNMAGNQLLDSENNLTDVLNVSGIPFFVVYDKEGKLHTYDALRPSSGDKLKQFLLSLQ